MEPYSSEREEIELQTSSTPSKRESHHVTFQSDPDPSSQSVSSEESSCENANNPNLDQVHHSSQPSLHPPTDQQNSIIKSDHSTEVAESQQNADLGLVAGEQDDAGDNCAAVLKVTQQATQSQPQPQPPSRVLTPPHINIMNEYGQQTDSIDIDPNNNCQVTGPEPLTEEEENAAVLVKNVSFGYTKKHDILSNISLCVPKGQIYALLGSSGCGKTTLLRIILGRIRQRRGMVRVFGAAPGTPECNIPGSGVGYMPQELALFGNFTIEETLLYFGMLHHMSKEEMREKMEFFIEFLNLPPKDRQISRCSGGQQRRVSIATTLFHNPPLLILDEPTVGVDPLLRCKIWQYLEYLCLTFEMTIIITTHYIEESRNASSLAFMRFGRILAQDTPDALLEQFECTILEDVFLKLCQQDCGEIKHKHSIKDKSRSKKVKKVSKNKPAKINHVSVDWRHLQALTFKNVTNLKRNPLVAFFYLILPVIQIVLFCYSVFKMPGNLPVSVYNGESKGMSKDFLKNLDPTMLEVNYYNSHEEAVEAVVEGRAWYGISIGANFTKAYRRRAKNPSDLSNEMFENSKIKLYADHSDGFILLTVYNSLINSYQKFVEGVVESFGFNKETVRLPIYLKEIVYGHYNPGGGYDILNNLTPGSLVAIIYTTPLIMASFVVVLERKGGIIERTFVSGATSMEVFLTHLFLLLVALVIQVASLMVVAFGIFELKIFGSLVDVFAMLYLQGLCGIMIGLFISSVSTNETIALVLALLMVFPVWMMCGVFWPLESLTPLIQKVFWCMPLSYPIRSIDVIVKRGWSLEFDQVRLGYAVSLGYNFVLLLANVVVFHVTSK